MAKSIVEVRIFLEAVRVFQVVIQVKLAVLARCEVRDECRDEWNVEKGGRGNTCWGQKGRYDSKFHLENLIFKP